MNKIKIAVLGGGVTGVTLAKELSKNSWLEIDLIEKAPCIGGFHRNFESGDLVYDIGAFTFFSGHSLFKTFPGISEIYQPAISNFGSVVGKNCLDTYPCTLKGYVKHNGLGNLLRTFLELPISKLLYWKRDTLTSFVKYYIGHSAYHKTGLKNYIERLYQASDRDIDIQFANKRLSCIARKGSLRKIVQRKFSGKKSVLGLSSKSVYVRPKEGFSKVYQEIHKRLLSNGVNVKLNSQLKSIEKITTGDKPKFSLEFAEGTKVYDEVVSTIPIPVVSRLIGKPLVKEFDTISLLTLFYRFKGDSGHNHNVLHNFTLDGSWKKITTFSNYYGKHEGDEYFSVEIPNEQGGELNVEQLRTEFESHVQSLGLYDGDLKLQDSLITKNAYPVYLKENVDEVLKVKNQLKAWGIYLAGRQGEFDYLNSSDASKNGLQVARLIQSKYSNSSSLSYSKNSPELALT